MAYLPVTQRCGHTTKLTIADGPLQAHYLQYHGGKLCESCRKQRVFEIAEKANADVWDRSRALGWVELRGTLKQIIYATSLRMKMVERMIQTAMDMGIPDYVADVYLEEMLANDAAKWWINNRDMNMVGLFEYPLDLS